MSLNPLLSVIVPVYNTKPYLAKCIDSILHQTYNNLEIILIDDGSTDGSGAVCDEYQQKDSRITVIHKPNGGQSDARNVGLKIMKGELIAFVDSDDWLKLDAYEKAIEVYLRTNAKIVIFGILYVFYNSFGRFRYEKPVNNYLYETGGVLTSDEALRILLEDKGIQFYMVNKIYKKNIFDGIEFPKGKTAEEGFIMPKLFERAETIAVVANHYAYNYLHRKNSTTSARSFNYVLNGMECTWMQYEQYKNYNETTRQALFGKIIKELIIAREKFPFKYNKHFKNKYKTLIYDNPNWKSYQLKLSIKLFLKLPYFMFFILFNPVTRFFNHIVKQRLHLTGANK
jgi:glycosyltransferase involved in cell wall biosynthesis